MIEIFKLLPRTNCRQCGEPACMVFAARVIKGAKGTEACTPLAGKQRGRLGDYMRRFDLGA